VHFFSFSLVLNLLDATKATQVGSPSLTVSGLFLEGDSALVRSEAPAVLPTFTLVAVTRQVLNTQGYIVAKTNQAGNVR
jgi:hypothetical protein